MDQAESKDLQLHIIRCEEQSGGVLERSIQSRNCSDEYSRNGMGLESKDNDGGTITHWGSGVQQITRHRWSSQQGSKAAIRGDGETFLTMINNTIESGNAGNLSAGSIVLI